MLIDLKLKGDSGIDLLHYITSHYPNMPTMVVSEIYNLFYVESALKAGARGYFHKSEPVTQYPIAIRKILNGGNYYSEQIAEKLINQKFSIIEILTSRELQIFQLLSQGKHRDKIAEMLSISPSTVSAHYENMKKKLHITTTEALIQYAMEWLQNRSNL